VTMMSLISLYFGLEFPCNLLLTGRRCWTRYLSRWSDGAVFINDYPPPPTKAPSCPAAGKDARPAFTAGGASEVGPQSGTRSEVAGATP
jgi:hypothetical protein